MDVISTRNNLDIDPYIHIWGYEIPIDLFLGGITAGLMIIIGIIVLLSKEKEYPGIIKWAPIMPFILISISLLCLWLDLHNKLNVYAFYLHFSFTSPMSFGSWNLVFVYPVSLGLFAILIKDKSTKDIAFGSLIKMLVYYVTILVTPFVSKNKSVSSKDTAKEVVDIMDQKSIGEACCHILKKDDEENIKYGLIFMILSLFGQVVEFVQKYKRVFAWSSIVVGTIIGIYTGILLSSMTARPFWNSGILGFLFLVSGISTSMALLVLLPTLEKEKIMLAKGNALVMVVELILLGSFILNLLVSYKPQKQGIELVLGGTFTAQFWVFVIFLGLVIPLILQVLELKKIFQVERFIQPILILIGGLSLRFIVVYAGQAYISM